MKHLVFFIVLSCSLLSACTSVTKSETPTPLVEIEEVEPAPATNNELSDAQLADIETIHATFSEVYPISLHESIKNFKADQDPNREIQIWMKMVETFKSLTSNGNYPRIEERQEVFSVILASTMMSIDKIKADVELEELGQSDVELIVNSFMARFSAN